MLAGTMIENAQARGWNGYQGEHWAAHVDRYDAVNGGFNEILVDAAEIANGDQVLDVGCGNGQLTRLAARRAGLGCTIGVDLSGRMLAMARSRAESEHVTNVSFHQGDAQVYPFAEGSFDVALSRFGVMFFADPIAAFTNIGRARPDLGQRRRRRGRVHGRLGAGQISPGPGLSRAGGPGPRGAHRRTAGVRRTWGGAAPRNSLVGDRRGSGLVMSPARTRTNEYTGPMQKVSVALLADNCR
jgi:SAM-dependent methyltransferase